MATDTDHHHHHHHHEQSYWSNNWSRPEIPPETEQPQVLSISDILDHGSISFGRFAAESLAWEKRSVFSHNRCQEELEKFKAPGFVAQKKAYFEEYYKRVRAMKALQAEQQQTTHPNSCLLAISNTAQVENDVDADLMKEEKKPINGSKLKILENEVAGNPDSSEGGILDRSKETIKEELSFCDNDNDKASIAGETSISLSSIDPIHSAKEASSSSTSSINRSSETTHHDCAVSVTAKHDANKQKKQEPILKAKARVSSSENKTQLDCRIAKGAVKPFEKPKLSLHNNLSGKTESSLVSSKRTPKTRNSNSNYVSSHRQHTEVCSSASVLHNSLARERSVTSPISIAGQVKANSASKGLLDNLPTKLPLHARTYQSTIKETAVTGGLRKKALDNRRSFDGDGRKPLEPSECQIRPKGRMTKNQRPKVMSMNLPVQDSLNQNCGVAFGQRSYVKGPQKKEEERSNAGLGKESKSASSNLSRIHKTPNPKLVSKISLPRSADLKHARREPRHQMPSWR